MLIKIFRQKFVNFVVRVSLLAIYIINPAFGALFL